MLCPLSIALTALLLGPPAPTSGEARAAGGATEPAAPPAAPPVRPTPPVRPVAPLGPEAPVGPDAQTGSADWLPNRGLAPLDAPTTSPPPSEQSSNAVSAPLTTATPPRPDPTALPADGAAPLTGATAPANAPGESPPTAVSPRIDMVRVEVLVGPVWRIRTTEAMALVGVEFGRLRGFSGAVQGGVIVAPDRDVVGVTDFPLGAGFVYRHRFGQRSLYGSVGLTAGLLIHRAGTDRGVVHRVDPDLQLPLRFTWTARTVGFSFALLQGFSARSRTYERRGTEVWHRIPYRIGFAVGIHFDIKVGRPRSRRSDREPKGPT